MMVIFIRKILYRGTLSWNNISYFLSSIFIINFYYSFKGALGVLFIPFLTPLHLFEVKYFWYFFLQVSSGITFYLKCTARLLGCLFVLVIHPQTPTHVIKFKTTDFYNSVNLFYYLLLRIKKRKSVSLKMQTNVIWVCHYSLLTTITSICLKGVSLLSWHEI